MEVTPLKIEIVKSGLTIKEVHEKSGININYLSMACNGRINLKPDHQVAIARALNKPVEHLFPKNDV